VASRASTCVRFEKHLGESIYVQRIWGGIARTPDIPELHHQFVVGTSRRDKTLRYNAAIFFALAGPARGGITAQQQEEFMRGARRILNSVFRPTNRDGSECRRVQFAYFSLPALVWELAHDVNLLDIYTFFCKSNLLTSKAPHSKGSQLRIDAAQYRFATFGHYGLGHR
jgi:hypothetical protein